ncbi:MAG: A/G-specific adenine glycosylase [Verrucomicrobiales bacterium]
MTESKPAQTRTLPKAKRAFQNAIIAWFSEHAEDYPWRRTHDPYAVLVSELMLQQTQVATVLGRRYFERWLEQFPDVNALADASEDEVLKAWEGLGYYRRARNLQKAARVVVDQFDGRFPEKLADILALPGVGRYTAGAIVSFAFDQSAAIVDANVARVLARLFDYEGAVDLPAGQQQVWAWAEELVPGDGVRVYNSGLMELGQKICTVRQPNCRECPVSAFCATRVPEQLPVKKPRTSTVFVDEHVVFSRDEDGGILLEQETGKRREGLWKLPEASDPPTGKIVLKMQYSITHYRVTLIVHEVCDAKSRSGRRFSAAALEAIAMPSPYRKALVALLANDDFALN